MPTPYLLINFPAGRAGAVTEADALDVGKEAIFHGATVRSWEDHTSYTGAATFAAADPPVVSSAVRYLIVILSGGQHIGVTEANYISGSHAAYFAGSTVVGWEDGTPWEGP